MEGLTFDTGALIGLERKDRRICKVLARARETNTRMTVPCAVIAEWWRGSSRIAELILSSVDVEDMDERLAKAAGEALAAVPAATAIDAIVMASAARRGDIVYTSDFGDLERLRIHFPTVRLLSL